MKVAEILKQKGQDVISVRPTETIDTLSHRLRMARIGAMVVTGEGGALIGIILLVEIVTLVGTWSFGPKVAESIASPTPDAATVGASCRFWFSEATGSITHGPPGGPGRTGFPAWRRIALWCLCFTRPI